MKGDEISITKVGYFFREPKFPVLGDFNGHVVAINNIEDTLKIKESVELMENTLYDIIDSTGEGWSLYHHNNSLIYSPLVLKKKWKKKEIIDLVSSRSNNNDNVNYNAKNPESKKTSVIIAELAALLQEDQDNL